MLCFQRLFMFSAQLLIKYVHQLPEKLISQIRRWGKISSTSKEDFDLSGFSEKRNGFPWFLYPKITLFLRICLKRKGHRSPEIPLEFYLFPSPDFPRFILGHFWGPKKTRKSQNRKNRKGAKKGEMVVFRVKLIKFAQFNDFSPFSLKMSFPWPPVRRCLCSHTFLIYFGRFWDGHLGKKPENALQNHILMKCWQFTHFSLKIGSGGHFPVSCPKGLPKHLRNHYPEQHLRPGTTETRF